MESAILKQILTELQTLNNKYDEIIAINKINQKHFAYQQKLSKILIVIMGIAIFISLFLIK